MKKLLLTFSIAFAVLLTACGGPSPKSVYEKIEKNEKLENADYQVMAEHLIKINSMDIEKLSDEDGKMLIAFGFAIDQAPEGAIDKATMEKLEKAIGQKFESLGAEFDSNEADVLPDYSEIETVVAAEEVEDYE